MKVLAMKINLIQNSLFGVHLTDGILEKPPFLKQYATYCRYLVIITPLLFQLYVRKEYVSPGVTKSNKKVEEIQGMQE